MRADEARALHDMLSRTVAVTDFLTARGTHDGCGECCSRFMPLTPGEVSVLRREVSERGIRLRPEGADIDLTCPLLGEDKRCMAYDVRPLICRMYDCSRHARGVIDAHPLMGRAEIVDMREVLA